MHSRWKNILVTGLKFAIPTAIIAFLLWRIEPEQWDALSGQPKHLGMLAAAVLVALTAISISFARWCVLVRCQEIEMTMVEAFRLGAIGFLLNFVSAGSVGGDLFKAFFLAKRSPGKRVEAVASVLVDRAVGLYGLLLMVAITLLVTGVSGFQGADTVGEDAVGGIIDMRRIKWSVATLVGIGTIVLSILVLGGQGVDRLITWAGTFPVIGSLVTRVGRPLRMFHTHTIAFFLAVVMSLCVHALLVVSFYLVARGLYASPPTLAEHFVIVPISLIASALPVTPAGVGILEAAMEALYRIVPASKTNASGTLVALVFEIVKVLIAVLGTVFYWTARQDVRETIEIAEQQAEVSSDT